MISSGIQVLGAEREIREIQSGWSESVCLMWWPASRSSWQCLCLQVSECVLNDTAMEPVSEEVDHRGSCYPSNGELGMRIWSAISLFSHRRSQDFSINLTSSYSYLEKKIRLTAHQFKCLIIALISRSPERDSNRKWEWEWSAVAILLPGREGGKEWTVSAIEGADILPPKLWKIHVACLAI